MLYDTFYTCFEDVEVLDDVDVKEDVDVFEDVATTEVSFELVSSFVTPILLTLPSSSFPHA